MKFVSLLGALVIGLVLFLPNLTAQAQATQSFKAFVNNPDKPLDIEADEVIVDQEKQSATFLGKVVIRQGKSRLTADKVTVTYDGKLLSKSKSRAVKAFNADGKVRISLGNDLAKADHLNYTFTTGIGVLKGNVELVQGKNSSQGERLEIDTNRGTIRMTGGKKGRVRAVLNPN